MRVRLSSFVLATLTVVSTVSFAAEQPPRNLHLVNGHWTAWEPPVPPEGAQVHVIQSGDTLWALAAQYYKDPYLWPQLWEKNKYILDAHWIYPGDPLLLGPDVATAGPVAEVSGTTPDTTGPGTGEAGPGEKSDVIPGVIPAAQAILSPVPLGYESDIYCDGYVGDFEESFSYNIVGSEYESLSPDRSHDAFTLAGRTIQGNYGSAYTVKYGLSMGDIVYLDGGREAGLSAGSVFTAVLPEKSVLHPVTREPIGRYYRYLGRVRVLSTQEKTAIGEIIQACDSILVGSHLVPFEPVPVPLGRPSAMRPVNFPASVEAVDTAPLIVYAKDDLIALGKDHVVHVNVGSDQEATPGDVYTIYRENTRRGLPPLVIGELAVLSVHKGFSVAKIIESRYAIYPGDRIVPK
ncbi:MAG TPA: LysM peptidoglycan-binding domain-containing protein [Thermoanaerobaculia bacterium]|nr:LysM peptidoglycan-binding domain-containing protein [Thermoanaerobaculia bacterium]